MIYKIGDKLKCIKDIHYKDRDSPLIDQTFEIVDYDFVTHKNYYLKETANIKNPLIRGYVIKIDANDMHKFSCLRLDRVKKINKLNEI